MKTMMKKKDNKDGKESSDKRNKSDDHKISNKGLSKEPSSEEDSVSSSSGKNRFLTLFPKL